MLLVIKVSSISVSETAPFSLACTAALAPVVTREMLSDSPESGSGSARHWSANGRPALASGAARSPNTEVPQGPQNLTSQNLGFPFRLGVVEYG